MKRTTRGRKDGEVVLPVTAPEARLLVSSYYAAQEMRKRLDLQVRHLGAKEAPSEEGAPASLPPFLQFVGDSWAKIESDVRKKLDLYARSSRVGVWCLSQTGCGPVLAAGLLAHLDITRAKSAGSFHAFAGLDPSRVWEKGQKRPYNAELKQLAFHLGECFKRSWKHPESYYGGIVYSQRKQLLVERNQRGHNAERAKSYRTKAAAVRKTLAEGELPAQNLDRQACNYAVKMFLSHLHAVMQFDQYGTVTTPYAVAHLGHIHLTEIRHTEDLFPGFQEAYERAGFKENSVLHERADPSENPARRERAGTAETPVAEERAAY